MNFDFYFTEYIKSAKHVRPIKYTAETFSVFSSIREYAIRLVLNDQLFKVDNIKPSTKAEKDRLEVKLLEQNKDENDIQKYYDDIFDYLNDEHKSNSCYIISHAIDNNGDIYNQVIFDMKFTDHLKKEHVSGEKVKKRQEWLKRKYGGGLETEKITVCPMYIKIQMKRQYSKENSYPYTINLTMMFSKINDDFVCEYKNEQDAKNAIKNYYDESCKKIKEIINEEKNIESNLDIVKGTASIFMGKKSNLSYVNLPIIALDFEKYINDHNDFPETEDIIWECLYARYKDDELTVYMKDNQGDEFTYTVEFDYRYINDKEYIEDIFDMLAYYIYEDYEYYDI